MINQQDKELIESIRPIYNKNYIWRVKINDTFKNNYDIIMVDQLVRAKLINEKTYYVVELKSKYHCFEKRLQGKNDIVNINKINSEIVKIINEIKDILSNTRINTYIESSIQLLNDYKYLKDEIDNRYFDQRIKIIEAYIDIAKKYCNIDITRIKDYNDDTCVGCGYSLSEEEPNENGIITCPNCSTQLENVGITKKDLVTTSGKTSGINDDSIENFKKVVEFYQCKNIKIKDEKLLIKELDRYFNTIPNLNRNNLMENPLDHYGIRIGTSHEMLLNALDRIGKTKYYKYVWYIGHKYWGWLVRDVSEIEDKIYRVYNLTQIQYNKIPIEKRERSSSLGTSFRLYKILEMLKHNCHIREFKIAENDKSCALHDELWEIMCINCNDSNIVYINTKKATTFSSFVNPNLLGY